MEKATLSIILAPGITRPGSTEIKQTIHPGGKSERNEQLLSNYKQQKKE